MANKNVSVWTSIPFWRRSAAWVTGFAVMLLIWLSFDTLGQISMGTDADLKNGVTKRVPGATVINYHIDYKFNAKRGSEVPVIGEKQKFFGRDDYSEEEAGALLHLGKLTSQSKNCMNCHTLLGNGAYFAPDLTKSWLLVAAIQFLAPGFLFEILDFSVARMVHINALVVWMLYAMIGASYWMLTDETEHEGVHMGLGKLAFWVLTAAVQVGAGTEASIWLIHEGREYIEAPRWADIGIVVVVLIFYWNMFATYMKGKQTGIMTVMIADLLALAGLYLTGMFFTDNISMDQFWWWWVIHLWVEATWEVFVGVLAAYALIKLIGAKREIVEMWLWIEVLMLFGSGVLGLGHHYFWIGTPEYWWEIGALFSALEPVPLVAMFVHVLYDWGKQQGAAKERGEAGSVIKN